MRVPPAAVKRMVASRLADSVGKVPQLVVSETVLNEEDRALSLVSK